MKKQEKYDIVKIYCFKNARYLESVDFFGIATNPLSIIKNDCVVTKVSFFHNGFCIDSNEIMKKNSTETVSIYKITDESSYKYLVINDIDEIEQLIDINTIYSIEHIGDAKIYKSPDEIDAELERMRIG